MVRTDDDSPIKVLIFTDEPDFEVGPVRRLGAGDDYFSISLMILYFAIAVWAMPNNYERSEWPLILFFALTAFFLVYVPFSKIGHYLYYPFTRYFLGRTMGHRGVGIRRKHDRKPDKM